MRKKKNSFTTKYVLLFSVLLLLTNLLLGVLMMSQARAAIKALVRKNMLDLSTTAAGLLDGDELGALTEADARERTPAFQRALKELTVFQNNTEVEYIYAVRQAGENRFVFTVDADPQDPADFGEAVLVTQALVRAAKGIPSVDTEPARDEWGNFYSAYSPVYDSAGRIAGIVGVDFDSAWYEAQIREHMLSNSLIGIGLLLAGGVIVLLFTRKLLKRLNNLKIQLSDLLADVNMLVEEINLESRYGVYAPEERKQLTAENREADAGDVIEELGEKMQVMHAELERYLEYSHAKAYTDGLTGAGNSMAYIETQERMNDRIQAGEADFAVTVFDINDLKKVNDRFGHAEGDRVISGAAGCIMAAFGREQTFRTGGDEFLAISERCGEDVLRRKIAETEAAIAAFNRKRQAEQEAGSFALLSVSMGSVFFRPRQDASFHDVFIRADEAMYQEKASFHQRGGQ